MPSTFIALSHLAACGITCRAAWSWTIKPLFFNCIELLFRVREELAKHPDSDMKQIQYLHNLPWRNRNYLSKTPKGRKERQRGEETGRKEEGKEEGKEGVGRWERKREREKTDPTKIKGPARWLSRWRRLPGLTRSVQSLGHTRRKENTYFGCPLMSTRVCTAPHICKNQRQSYLCFIISIISSASSLVASSLNSNLARAYERKQLFYNKW